MMYGREWINTDGLRPRARLVLLALLALRANGFGAPTVLMIARRAELSTRTTRRALKDLEAAGRIKPGSEHVGKRAMDTLKDLEANLAANAGSPLPAA